jgi:hypothetical protein
MPQSSRMGISAPRIPRKILSDKGEIIVEKGAGIIHQPVEIPTIIADQTLCVDLD